MNDHWKLMALLLWKQDAEVKIAKLEDDVKLMGEVVTQILVKLGMIKKLDDRDNK